MESDAFLEIFCIEPVCRKDYSRALMLEVVYDGSILGTTASCARIVSRFNYARTRRCKRSDVLSGPFAVFHVL